MTWYKFAGRWYEAHEDDPSTYIPIVDAMLGHNLLGGELAGFVNSRYDLPHLIIEEMVDWGAKEVFDEIMDAFTLDMATHFDLVGLPYMEAVQEEMP